MSQFRETFPTATADFRPDQGFASDCQLFGIDLGRSEEGRLQKAPRMQSLMTGKPAEGLSLFAWTGYCMSKLRDSSHS